MAPEPPKASGNGVVRPVCASIFISSGAISPLFSASRARGRSCSLATLYARLRISSCSSVGAKLSMDSFLSLTFFPGTEARDHVPQEVNRSQSLACKAYIRGKAAERGVQYLYAFLVNIRSSRQK